MGAWLRHLVSATGWSASGLRFLFGGEMAARMELAAAIVAFAWLFAIGRSAVELALFVALALVAIAVEALNTAVEAIVDEVSPQRSEFARRAKDVGSAAVLLALAAAGVYALTLSALWLAGR
jgi:diacylglycerol kinase (ATP)